MKLSSKKNLNQFTLFLVGLFTLYAIWAMAGIAMFVLTIATSPLTASLESLAFDYSVWAVITGLLLLPGIKLFYSEHKTVDFSVWRLIRGYWFYLVPAYGVLLATVFFASSIVWYQIIMTIKLGISIWYFINFKKCVLKK